MKFRNKKSVVVWLESFAALNPYDPIGDKYYFVFGDMQRGGRYTLMQYPDGRFTLHGQGSSYCDEKEKEMPIDQLTTFIWKNRKAIHKEMKVTL